MCTKAECISILNRLAPHIRQEFGVTAMRLFGSVARGDNHSDSDIDIYVEMPPKIYKVLALKSYLQDQLGTAVDLVRKCTNMNEFLSNEINRDGIVIFS